MLWNKRKLSLGSCSLQAAVSQLRGRNVRLFFFFQSKEASWRSRSTPVWRWIDTFRCTQILSNHTTETDQFQCCCWYERWNEVENIWLNKTPFVNRKMSQIQQMASRSTLFWHHTHSDYNREWSHSKTNWILSWFLSTFPWPCWKLSCC